MKNQHPISFNYIFRGGSFGDYVWGQNGLDDIITQVNYFVLKRDENVG